MQETFSYSTATTKRELIHIALKEHNQNHRRRNVQEIKSKVKLNENYNNKPL